MQPLFEAQGLQREKLGVHDVPPIVTQIADGENGHVMMHEFPDGYRNGIRQLGDGGVAAVNGTEYLELLERAGVREDAFPPMQPLHQARVFERIRRWEPGAADRALEEIRRDEPEFVMEGGSWTNDRSWVQGYENVLNPMMRLSAEFHRRVVRQIRSTSSMRSLRASASLLAREMHVRSLGHMPAPTDSEPGRQDDDDLSCPRRVAGRVYERGRGQRRIFPGGSGASLAFSRRCRPAILAKS